MAVGKIKLYAKAKLALGNKEIDLDSDSLVAALFLSTSNCNTLTGHDQLSDLTNEVSVSSYVATPLTGVTWSDSGGTITLDCDPVEFQVTGDSIVARYLVIYDDTHPQDIPIAVALLDTTPGDITVTDGNSLTITPNASGLFTLSGATSDT